MSARTHVRVPKYRLHKPTGLAVVRLSGRDLYLGPYGTPESGCRAQNTGTGCERWRTATLFAGHFVVEPGPGVGPETQRLLT